MHRTRPARSLCAGLLDAGDALLQIVRPGTIGSFIPPPVIGAELDEHNIRMRSQHILRDTRARLDKALSPHPFIHHLVGGKSLLQYIAESPFLTTATGEAVAKANDFHRMNTPLSVLVPNRRKAGAGASYFSTRKSSQSTDFTGLAPVDLLMTSRRKVVTPVISTLICREEHAKESGSE